jgi:O-succinylbenzoic acid--CoA ligase
VVRVKLEAIPLDLDPRKIAAAVPTLDGLLSGHGAVLPTAPGREQELLSQMAATGTTADAGDGEAPGTLIACTSGSTGTPKGARLRTSNLTASADATAAYLAARFGTATGPWLLALPPHHIAGLQVILRSLYAGHSPTVLPGGRFTPEAFAHGTATLRAAHPSEDLHTSLVPTQLQRLMVDAQGRKALHEYAAVLVGGAATSPGLVDAARDHGVHVVLTYGSSETAGGMVYDGRALPGTRVAVDHATGRILLSGPTVAEGYCNVGGAAGEDAFPARGTFRTSDLGSIDDGLLTVRGRADGAINSGGMKVLPEEVEAALATLGYTACVVGLPDTDWGEAVTALVEVPGEAPAERTAQVRSAMKDAGLPSHLVPRRVLGTRRLPVTGPGKVDRRAVRDELRTRLED